MKKNEQTKLLSYANKLEKLQNEASDYVIKVTKNPFNFAPVTPQNLRDLALRGEKK